MRYLSRIYGFDKNGELYEKFLPYHVCTKEDFDLFDSPDPNVQIMYDKYYSGEMKLYCLDWEETKNELKFWGQEKTRSNY